VGRQWDDGPENPLYKPSVALPGEVLVVGESADSAHSSEDLGGAGSGTTRDDRRYRVRDRRAAIAQAIAHRFGSGR
jgi:hypothetical protein